MSLDLIRRLTRLEKRLDDFPGPEICVPYFFTTPLTNASFNGDSFSDVAVTTKIENTGWSTTIPADAKALLIRISARDSGSAANTVYFNLYPASGATTAALSLTLTDYTNDTTRSETGVIPCTDGDLWYQCGASGADTLDVWLYCFGYWI